MLPYLRSTGPVVTTQPAQVRARRSVRDQDVFTYDDRRRVAGPIEGHFPLDVFGRRPGERCGRFAGLPGTLGTAPGRPIGGGEREVRYSNHAGGNKSDASVHDTTSQN